MKRAHGGGMERLRCKLREDMDRRVELNWAGNTPLKGMRSSTPPGGLNFSAM